MWRQQPVSYVPISYHPDGSVAEAIAVDPTTGWLPPRRRWRLTKHKLRLWAGLVVAIVVAAFFVITAVPVGNTILASEGDSPVGVGAPPPNNKPITGTANCSTGGSTRFKGQQVSYRMHGAIVANCIAFKTRFPGAKYAGDIGDARHQAARTPLDHTPGSKTFCFQGKCPQRGWIYAQDLAGGGKFDLTHFARWILDAARAGKYPELKQVITHMAGNRHTANYGAFDCRNGFKKSGQASTHSSHIHLGYKPGYEQAGSKIIADYASAVGA